MSIGYDDNDDDDDSFNGVHFCHFSNDMDVKNEYTIDFNYGSQFYTIQKFVLVCDWITLLSTCLHY